MRHCRHRSEHIHGPYPHEADIQAEKKNIKQVIEQLSNDNSNHCFL